MIEVERLSKIYQMGEQKVSALDGVDFRIEKGEFVVMTTSIRNYISTLSSAEG